MATTGKESLRTGAFFGLGRFFEGGGLAERDLNVRSAPASHALVLRPVKV